MGTGEWQQKKATAGMAAALGANGHFGGAALTINEDENKIRS
jgi:hypothetical protein